MILKLLPLWGTPKRSPAGVPVTSPRTDDTVPGDEEFLDVELHVGDGFGKASDHFDRGITAPAFAGQIAPARLVVRGEDLLLERVHIASVRLCAGAASEVVSTAAAATSRASHFNGRYASSRVSIHRRQ